MWKEYFKCFIILVGFFTVTQCFPKKQFKENITTSPEIGDVKCRQEDGYQRCIGREDDEMICTRRDHTHRNCEFLTNCNDNHFQTGVKCYSRYEVKRFLVNTHSRCHADEFECKLTKECIPRSWIQDGEDDCSYINFGLGIDDGSDETEFLESCNIQTEFRCTGDKPRCVPRHWVQDGDVDCSEGNDETDILTCMKNTEFHCTHNNRCILRLMINDGYPDCPNGTDEHVHNLTCIDELDFRCKNGRCIPRVWVGNGLEECSEGEDEVASMSTCFQGEFQCLDHRRCLPVAYRCDGAQHCPDGSDEIELCSAPAMYRVSNESWSLISWSFLLYKDRASLYRFHQMGIQSAHELLFGMKCYVGLYFGKVEEMAATLRTIPQFYILNNISVCYNKEDVCFDQVGTFLCSRCLDGTIISPAQVCDGVVDCHDLSDECPCESSQVRELCEELPFRNKPEMELKSHLICDRNVDFINGLDEQFCETNVFEYKKHINFNNKYPEMNTEMACLSANGTTALLCNGIIECPLMEDECIAECLVYKLSNAESIERAFEYASLCYPFLRLPETYEFYSDETDFFARFKVSNHERRIEVIEPTSGQMEGSTDIEELHEDDYENTCEYLVSVAYNSSYSIFVSSDADSPNCHLDGAYKNLDFLCDLEGVECPWFHVCEHDKSRKIEVKKLCDGSIDCKDKSDGENCPYDSHFYCNNGLPLFIERHKVGDGRSDCSDRSDECKETSYASAVEMLKSIFLRYFIWVCAILIVTCNAIVIRKHFRKMAGLSSKKSVAYCNTFLLTNLAFSDTLFGFTLLLVGVKSHQFSGKYCEVDLKWRCSFLCNMIGIFTLVSSQTTINFLVVITGLRLYITYKPFMTNRLSRNIILFVCLMCWLVAVFIATYPVWGTTRFIHSFYVEQNAFLDDQIVRRASLEGYVSTTQDIAPLSNLTSMTKSSSFVPNILREWYFNTERGKTDYPYRHVNIKGYFGFYSSSSVCFPDLYTHISPASEYSLFVVLLNFAFLIFICIGYAIIFHRARKSKQIGRKRAESTVDKKDSKMLRRIIYIVLSDMACWFPIIVMTVISYNGYKLPEIIHSISAIVFLPINSLINPIIYSRLDKVIWTKIVQICKPLSDKCKKEGRTNHVTDV